MDGKWQYIHIPRSRIFDATNRTFLGLLRGEYRNPEVECPVYGQEAADGDGYCYYFSPQATVQFRVFLKVWGGSECDAPKHLKMMSRII